MKFQLSSSFSPAGDQSAAIADLVRGIEVGRKEQVLLGVTGSGKTFSMANVIARLNRPALIFSHNKTLAIQLYQEFRDFFPQNAVSYFVSYYDYYQPEAYIAASDTYIEKETEINEEIDKLRLAATTNLLTRPDTIIIASVSCIYNIGSPREYGHFVLELTPGVTVSRESILERLIQLQYERSDYGFHRGTFRVRGEFTDVFTAYEDVAIRIEMNGNRVVSLSKLDPLTGKIIEMQSSLMLYPAKHYMTDPAGYKEVFSTIRKDLEAQVKHFKDLGKILEAHRIEQRVNYDLEMISEMGYVNGVENYSRYFDGRTPGSAPYTLFDYFEEATKGSGKWLLFVDESHITIPQIRGMYHGDRSRKQNLVDYGFRLPAALDNRPLMFSEFLRRIPQTVYVSATPDEWEKSRALESAPVGKESGAGSGIVEQLVRPTGLLDPVVSVRPSTGQIEDLIVEIANRKLKNERVLVTTLTKRMAEDLSEFLEQKGILVSYLHSDIHTLERSDILTDLRSGKYDVIIGVNLLREGLDLPEVSLVAILDADKEGFLRSRTSLIQTMGRAARHERGEVILYADRQTDSMRFAIAEGQRRRKVQLAFNKDHNITPLGIQKPIRDRVVVASEVEEQVDARKLLAISEKDLSHMTPQDLKKYKEQLATHMRRAARDMHFEEAAQIRDLIASLK